MFEHVTAARAIVKYKINIFSCYHPLTRILAPTIRALPRAVTNTVSKKTVPQMVKFHLSAKLLPN